MTPIQSRIDGSDQGRFGIILSVGGKVTNVRKPQLSKREESRSMELNRCRPLAAQRLTAGPNRLGDFPTQQRH